MNYNITLDGLSENCPTVDDAMELCFLIYPNASFSSWNDSQDETWLDILDGSEKIGKIMEL